VDRPALFFSRTKVTSFLTHSVLDPANIKWKDLLSPGITVPTEYGKEKREALAADRRKLREEQARAIEEARKKGTNEAGLRKIEAGYREADKAIAAKIDAVHKQYASLEDKVGAFEGAGYASTGLYRPMMFCIMGSGSKGEFCRVCRQAISRMIDYFTESK
jgi:hypothetical protein